MTIENNRGNRVYIVGIGPGGKDYILPKAVEVLNSCDQVIGFERAIGSLGKINCNKVIINSLKAVLDYLNNNKDRSIAIAASGDPCFYGITDFIEHNYEGEIEVIPGISSFQYMASRLKKPWQGALLCSVHGRAEKVAEKVKENSLSIWLTDKISTPGYICRQLIEHKINADVYVGENLSYEDEKIYTGSPEQIANLTFKDLCVVIVEVN